MDPHISLPSARIHGPWEAWPGTPQIRSAAALTVSQVSRPRAPHHHSPAMFACCAADDSATDATAELGAAGGRV